MNTVTHTKSFEMAVPVAQLFPLFSPEGEKLWVPGWDYQNVMGTTELSEDYVFVTKAHDHSSETAVWIVKKYEPDNYYIQFYRVEAGEKVGIVTVACTELAAAETNVAVTYEYVALSAVGEKFIEGFTAEFYRTFIDEWETLLLRYFGLIA